MLPNGARREACVPAAPILYAASPSRYNLVPVRIDFQAYSY